MSSAGGAGALGMNHAAADSGLPAQAAHLAGTGIAGDPGAHVRHLVLPGLTGDAIRARLAP